MASNMEVDQSGSSQQLRPLRQPILTCRACSFSGARDEFRIHIQSEEHKHKSAQKAFNVPGVEVKDGRYRCKDCDLVFKNLDEWKQHINSLVHMRTEERLKPAQVAETDDYDESEKRFVCGRMLNQVTSHGRGKYRQHQDTRWHRRPFQSDRGSGPVRTQMKNQHPRNRPPPGRFDLNSNICNVSGPSNGKVPGAVPALYPNGEMALVPVMLPQQSVGTQAVSPAVMSRLGPPIQRNPVNESLPPPPEEFYKAPPDEVYGWKGNVKLENDHLHPPEVKMETEYRHPPVQAPQTNESIAAYWKPGPVKTPDYQLAPAPNQEIKQEPRESFVGTGSPHSMPLVHSNEMNQPKKIDYGHGSGQPKYLDYRPQASEPFVKPIPQNFEPRNHPFPPRPFYQPTGAPPRPHHNWPQQVQRPVVNNNQTPLPVPEMPLSNQRPVDPRRRPVQRPSLPSAASFNASQPSGPPKKPAQMIKKPPIKPALPNPVAREIGIKTKFQEASRKLEEDDDLLGDSEVNFTLEMQNSDRGPEATPNILTQELESPVDREFEFSFNSVKEEFESNASLCINEEESKREDSLLAMSEAHCDDVTEDMEEALLRGVTVD